jgi:hypothetical protein
MFAVAIDQARRYTMPVLISQRYFNGDVRVSIGAHVLVNDDGWIVTAAHMFDLMQKFQHDQPKIADYEQKVAAARAKGKTPQQAAKLARRIPHDDGWLQNVSYWWGMNGADAQGAILYKNADLAIAQLQPFNAATFGLIGGASFATIKDPASVMEGRSLCRIGFPFHDATSAWDVTTGQFVLAQDVLPVPFFANEGIYSRQINIDDGQGHMARMIETSSPGLRGQSGGPLFDADGNVWGIQSRTVHHNLGFDVQAIQNGRQVEIPQFLNAGWATHPETLTRFLQDHNVRFTMSS